MASIDDIGVPGQPMDSPPLTEWQAAVRDAIKAGGTWVAYIPAVTGATYSSLLAHYVRNGDLVTVSIRGTVATVTGDISFGTPVAADAAYAGVGLGSVRMVAGAGIYHAHSYLGGAATIHVRVAGTNGLTTTISPTVPSTWAPGNQIAFVATYKAAS